MDSVKTKQRETLLNAYGVRKWHSLPNVLLVYRKGRVKSKINVLLKYSF